MNKYDVGGGAFLKRGILPDEVFTPEDFTPEQLSFAETARNFVKKEVLPLSGDIEAKKPGLMRSLIEKAGGIARIVDKLHV